VIDGLQPEERGKQSKLSFALDIWRQNIYTASQSSQLIEMGMKGGFTERRSEAAVVTFSMSGLGLHTDVQKELLKISQHHSTIIYIHTNTKAQHGFCSIKAEISIM